MNRPFVVCHMLASLDGKIDGDFFGVPETSPALKAYGDLRKYYHCPGTLYGSTTMLGGYADGLAANLPGKDSALPCEDWVNEEGRGLGNYIISVDPKGTLAFSNHVLEKKGRSAAHVIEALTNQASPDYLAYLQKQGVSYLFAGEEQLNCSLLLEKLHRKFGVQRLMVAGGGVVNWSFLKEGLIDELSLVLAPVADGNTTSVSVFEQAAFLPPHGPISLTFKQAEALERDILWLRYTAK